MKLFVVLFLASLAGTYGNHAHNALQTLIRKEVKALLAQDTGLTVDNCTTKCDALFDLVISHDEKATDKMCHTACMCQIHPNSCQSTTTHKPHHTHAPTTVPPTAPTTAPTPAPTVVAA